MGLVQLKKGYSDMPTESQETLILWYDEFAKMAKELMMSKNHDYGDTWRRCVSRVLPTLFCKRF